MEPQQAIDLPRMITPSDADFDHWNSRDANLRFKGKPLRIIPVSSTKTLEAVLQQTVDEGLRFAIRGGGHCLENFVCDPAVQVVIDISGMKGIRYDAGMNAIEVCAGNTLGEINECLFHRWGTVLPSGEHPAIGIGGHIPGGAFGFLCRRYGLGVDYLFGLEMLFVNVNGRVEKVIATCAKDDPNRELWWAHTGGGAGNFGVVIKYWFRDPDAKAADPAALLPAAPDRVLTMELAWKWAGINQTSFIRLLNNFGEWAAKNSAPGAPANCVFATLHVFGPAAGSIMLKAVSPQEAHSGAVLEDLEQALSEGVGAECSDTRQNIGWLDFALNPFPDIFGPNKGAFKVKDAFLLQPFSQTQLETIHRLLTESPETPGVFLGMATYGGEVNAISAELTATAQRSAIMTTSCTAGWADPADEEKHVAWTRKAYAELFAESGGAPVPNSKTGGCIIAHPDNDLADPQLNKSGVPWYRFYYQQHYPRLQAVKTTWDPLNIFRHALSIQP